MTPNLNKALIPIFFIVLVDLMAMMMMIPLLPFYAERFGANAFLVGLLASSFAICQLVASPLLGKLSDRIGRRPVLILSQFGTFLGLLMMAFAHHLWVLFAARIIDGITAGNITLAQAAVADVTTSENRAKAFGIIGVAFGIGLVLGPAISGILAAYDWTYPIYAASALSFLSMLITYVLFHESPTNPESLRPWWEMIRSQELLRLLGEFSVFVFAFAYMSGGLALFAQARFHTAGGHAYGPTEIGYLFAYCGVLGILIQGWLIGVFVRQFGEEKMARFAFVSDFLGYGALGFIFGVPGLLMAATLFSTGNSVLRPVLTSLITQQVSKDEQGLVIGLTGSLQSLGQVVVPPLGGLLIDGEYFVSWAVGLALICLIGFILSQKKAVA